MKAFGDPFERGLISQGIELRLLGMHALQLPHTKGGACGGHGQRQQPAGPERQAPAAHRAMPAHACDNAGHRIRACIEAAAVNDSLKTLVVVAFLIVILWNLGSALYYLLVDRGQSKRTVNALTRRIGLSVALILLVILGIWTGVIQPHGVGR